jgi:anti-sigma factor RsiW
MGGREDPGLLACEQVCERLSEYVDRELDPAERASISGHLQACRGCERMARELAELVRALHALSCCERG